MRLSRQLSIIESAGQPQICAAVPALPKGMTLAVQT